MLQGIDSRAQANAVWMEHKILDHVKDALRVTIDWRVPAVGLPRKLSSVQFTLKSFQRHLLRLIDLEEQGGYMQMVTEQKPHFNIQVERLQEDHAQFRRHIEELLPEVEALSEYDSSAFEGFCQEISWLLERVDQHDREETALLQDSLLFDEGGEG